MVPSSRGIVGGRQEWYATGVGWGGECPSLLWAVELGLSHLRSDWEAELLLQLWLLPVSTSLHHQFQNLQGGSAQSQPQALSQPLARVEGVCILWDRLNLSTTKEAERSSFWETFILKSQRGVLASAATTPTQTTLLTASKPVRARDFPKPQSSCGGELSSLS